MAAAAAAASWLEECPRPMSVPLPTPMTRTAAAAATGRGTKAAREDTLKAMREKLSQFQAENTLLGTLVKELKAERESLQKRLTASQQQHNDASSRAAAATQQADAAGRDHRRLTAEVDRLQSVLHSHSVRLHKAKSHQQELEDVALDLQARLDEAREQQEAAERAAAAAAQRATAAEAKLEAAGFGPMPKMGPTAEQLVINSTQRIRELSEELSALKAEAQQWQANTTQQLQAQEQQWQQQLAAATAAAQEVQQQLQRRLQQQLCELQQQQQRVQEGQQQCRELQQQLFDAQLLSKDAQRKAQAHDDMDCRCQALSSTNQTLQQQVSRLQQQLAETQSAHAAAAADQQQSLQALQRQRQELGSSLAAVRQAETAHRLGGAEASSKVERLRGELLRSVEELQSQLTASALSAQQQQQLRQQLRVAEATAAAAREEAQEARQQLVELASASLTELREQVAGEAGAIIGLPEGLDAAALPSPVVEYVQVLEHAVCDCEQRSKQLLEDALAAQQHERSARQALAQAQEAQAAAERALQQQTQRLLAAERRRLSDLKEQQSLEKRLALAQQECGSLRDALLNRSGSSSSIGWQLQAAEAYYLPLPSKAVLVSPVKRQQEAHTVQGTQLSLQPQHMHQQPQVQQPRQEQQLLQQQPRQEQVQGDTAHLSVADAGQSGPEAAASSGALINRYQAKLAQLRQMKEQLLLRKAPAPVGLNSMSRAHDAGAQQQQQHSQQQQQHSQQQHPGPQSRSSIDLLWCPDAAWAASGQEEWQQVPAGSEPSPGGAFTDLQSASSAGRADHSSSSSGGHRAGDLDSSSGGGSSALLALAGFAAGGGAQEAAAAAGGSRLQAWAAKEQASARAAAVGHAAGAEAAADSAYSGCQGPGPIDSCRHTGSKGCSRQSSGALTGSRLQQAAAFAGTRSSSGASGAAGGAAGDGAGDGARAAQAAGRTVTHGLSGKSHLQKWAQQSQQQQPLACNSTGGISSWRSNR